MIVREGKIRLTLEQVRSKLEAPDVSAVEKALRSEQRAAEDATKANDELNRSHKERGEAVKQSAQEIRPQLERVGRAHEEMGRKAELSYEQIGEGAFRAARGLALLAASGNENLRSLVLDVATVQGAFDGFRGTTKILNGVGLSLGRLHPYLLAATLAATAGAVAWRRYNDSLEETARAEREVAKAAEERRRAQGLATVERISGRETDEAAALRRHTEAAVRPEEKERRLRAELEEVGRERIRDSQDEYIIREKTRRQIRDRAGYEPTVFDPYTYGVSQDSAIRANQERLVREQMAGAEHELELQQRLYQQDQARLEQQRQAELNSLSSFGAQGGVAAPGMGTFNESREKQINAEYDSRQEARARRLESAADELVQIMEKLVDRQRQIENAQ